MQGLRVRQPPEFPLARCPFCAVHAICADRGTPDPIYPSCRIQAAPIASDQLAALLAAIAQADGQSPAWLAKIHQFVVAQAEVDGGRFGASLELSASWDNHGWHFSRFSYALPWYADAPDQAKAVLGAVAELCGLEATGELVRRLAALWHPCVELPLFGLAGDGPGRWRHKVYLQFKPGSSANGLAIAETLSGLSGLARHFAGRNLHMIGLDTHADGSWSTLKLYVMVPLLPTRQPGLGEGLLQTLADNGVPYLRDALLIWRLRPGDDLVQAQPTEVDFAPEDSGLLWADIAALPLLQAVVGPPSPWQQLERTFSLAVRRVSAPLYQLVKLNLYYVAAQAHHGAASVLTRRPWRDQPADP